MRKNYKFYTQVEIEYLKNNYNKKYYKEFKKWINML